MMDFLLTHGYFLSEDQAERRIMKPYAPLGILYISSYLKARGFSVGVFDTTFSSMTEFEAYVRTHRPRAVGISANLMTKLNVLRQMRFCRSLGITVIVGGPDVPEYAREYIRHGADIAVIGEGEESAAEAFEVLLGNDLRKLENVTGIAYRGADGEIIHNSPRPLIKDLDQLPFPDREAIDINKYLETWRTYHGMGSVSLICSRGCPYTCTWCSRSVYGETHRRRSVESVITEIEYLRERYNPDMLWFADDVFTINHKWFFEFAAAMKKRDLRIPFECISRADRLNEDVLKEMANLRCFRVWFGSESGSQRILDAMKRRVTVEEIRSATQSAQKYGIQAGLFVMLGYPGETIEDIEETIDHLRATNPDAYLHTIAYPIKGTELYERMHQQIESPASWTETTDRRLRMHGRYSDRFYWFAIRYLVNSMEFHTLNRRKNGVGSMAQKAVAFAKAKVSRLGMELFQADNR